MATKLISKAYFEAYQKKQKYSLAKHLKEISNLGKSNIAFAFTKSSVFSSLIEGSSIDLDNYLFNKEVNYQSTGMQEIEDLINAYKFAKTHALNEKNILQAHKILSNSFNIPNEFKGKIRTKDVRIGNWIETVYTATPTSQLNDELSKFYSDLNILLKRKKYTYNEAFYHASMVHLVFVNIHPFADGNGRLSRLIEKWFLSQLIGTQAWSIHSEINYWLKRDNYYKTLNAMGKTYASINYNNAVPFLLMLPFSFGLSKKYYK